MGYKNCRIGNFCSSSLIVYGLKTTKRLNSLFPLDVLFKNYTLPLDHKIITRLLHWAMLSWQISCGTHMSTPLVPKIHDLFDFGFNNNVLLANINFLLSSVSSVPVFNVCVFSPIRTFWSLVHIYISSSSVFHSLSSELLHLLTVLYYAIVITSSGTTLRKAQSAFQRLQPPSYPFYS